MTAHRFDRGSMRLTPHRPRHYRPEPSQDTETAQEQPVEPEAVEVPAEDESEAVSAVDETEEAIAAALMDLETTRRSR